MRDIRLRLIIVVIGDKILDGIFREILTELGAKLCCKGLIVSQNEGRAVYSLYNTCHGKGLTGAGNAEQHLLVDAVFDAVYKLIYSLRLISHRFVR